MKQSGEGSLVCDLLALIEPCAQSLDDFHVVVSGLMVGTSSSMRDQDV